MAANPEWLNASSSGIKPHYALTIIPDRQCGADHSMSGSIRSTLTAQAYEFSGRTFLAHVSLSGEPFCFTGRAMKRWPATSVEQRSST